MVSWSLVYVCWCSGVCFHIFLISELYLPQSSLDPVFHLVVLFFWFGFVNTYYCSDDIVAGSFVTYYRVILLLYCLVSGDA